MSTKFLPALIVVFVGIGTAAAATRGSTTYTARVFMKGMQVTVPSPAWAIHEDHPGEFNLAAPGAGTAGAHIHFWLDPIAAGPHEVVVRGVGRTPAALLRWLRGDRDFVVSAPRVRRIAGGLAATSVDIDVAATGPKEDPGCPGPCTTVFVFRGHGYSFPFGIGRGEPVRLYFATIGKSVGHTFLIAVDGGDPPSQRAFRNMLPAATRIVSSIRLPTRISAG